MLTEIHAWIVLRNGFLKPVKAGSHDGLQLFVICL
jgi:hypothetical protein